MAKDPAVLWYPGDWISGTHGMTLEEKGAYMELLMMQFNRGHMTTHMIGQVVGQVWGQIKHKFLVDNEGNWYNERLDIEKEKRKSFTNSRKNNLTGKNQYSKNGHMSNHMENVNENRNTNGSIVKGIKFDENFEKVFLSDGSSQLLGNEQKVLASGGDIYPSTIIKGSIY
jgi:uncharacterized protein YdaU (DUF1376 family)